MTQKSMSKKGIVVLSTIVVLLLVGFSLIYWNSRPDTSIGKKDIVVEVVVADEPSKEIAISTDAEYLRQALEEKSLIQGDESEYGLFVKTVDGVTANDANQEWWCFTVGGEEIMLGVDDIPVHDGDHFEITLKVGY